MKTVDGLSESPARRRRPLSSRLSADRFIATVHAAASLSLSLSLCLSVCLSVCLHFHHIPSYSTLLRLIPPNTLGNIPSYSTSLRLIPPNTLGNIPSYSTLLRLIPPNTLGNTTPLPPQTLSLPTCGRVLLILVGFFFFDVGPRIIVDRIKFSIRF